MEERPIYVRLAGDGPAESVEVMVYFYLNGLPTAERQYYYLEPGDFDFAYTGHGRPKNVDSVRLSVRMSQLTGPVRLSVEG
jgi:hypothetical protein